MIIYFINFIIIIDFLNIFKITNLDFKQSSLQPKIAKYIHTLDDVIKSKKFSQNFNFSDNPKINLSQKS